MDVLTKNRESAHGNAVIVESIRDDPESFKLTWTIENYSSMAKAEVVKSSVFQAGSKSNHQWRLGVYPRRQICLFRKQYFGYFLEVVDFGTAPACGKVPIICDFSFVRATGELTFPHTKGPRLLEKGHHNEWYPIASTKTITDPVQNLLKNDVLTVHLLITLESNEEPDQGPLLVTVPTTLHPPTATDEKKLEILTLFRNSIPEDVTVKSANQEFGAHADFLKVVCPAMFPVNMLRSKDQRIVVDVSAFDDDVVEGLLDYVYEGETGLLKTRGKAAKLLALAKEYGMIELKKLCDAAIKDNFQPTVDTVLDDLLIAHCAGMEDLKNICLAFFHKYSHAVKHSKSYRRHVESPQIGIIFSLYTDFVAPRSSS